ncbi:hypothetical protein D7030_03065 [Flavobacteriaceae bacterium AU392]|nr:hypothetical protein D1817_09540 [Flavobacteriaceae bacterium]RKM85666.1 hypothetical protein D7030_03065 [Flavobacteriaceae bacterium AU392]
MRKTAFLFVVFFTVIIGAQSELTSASVEIDIKDTSYIEVKQTLLLNIPDSIQQLNLKLLKFEGISVTLNKVNSNKEMINFTKEDSKELQEIILFSNGRPFQTIELNYSVQVENEEFYLPLFFTELLASSSDNDFFNARIKMQNNQNIIMHFPNVELTENVEFNKKNITMQVPALPSLFRMEFTSETVSRASVTAIVDWVIALVFVLIGIIIWRNRKQLMYG